MSNAVTFLGGSRKLIVLWLLLTASTIAAYSQCGCPPIATCSACSGGLNSVKVEWTGGGIVVTITASDEGGGLTVLGLLGNTVQINSRDGQPFDGDVTVNVTGIPGGSVTFPTSCSAPQYQGTDLGDFIILEGTSMAGPICCSPPIINNCPSDFTVAADADCTNTIVNWTAPTAFDACGIASFTRNKNPGDPFPLGTTTVTYTATDLEGNVVTCQFDVEVEDQTDPVITDCPGDDTKTLNSSCEYVLQNFIAAFEASDNCSSGSLVYTQSPLPGTILTGVGAVHTITMTATDENNNSASCTFDITLLDTAIPTITFCQGNVSKSVGPGCTYPLEDFTGQITASDNCSEAEDIVYTQAPVAGTALGGVGSVHTITLTATDESNNSTSCFFDITLVDTTVPVVVSCPPSVTKDVDGSCGYVLENFLPLFSATDNCTPDPGIVYTQSPASGAILSGAVPEHTVTMTARDQSNNLAICTFTVTLQDVTDPVITFCPININRTLNASCNYTLLDFTALMEATDNCTASGNIVFTQLPLPGTILNGASTVHTITMTATDESNNASSCTFDITLQDTTLPVISSCQGDVTRDIASGDCTYTLESFTNAITATDNCTSSGNIVYTQSPLPGTTLNGAGSVHTITLTATDESNNAASCTFDITLQDVTDPVINSCQGDVTEDIAGGSCAYALEDFTAFISATDNCSSAGNITYSQSPAVGTPLIGAGSIHTITLTATDQSNNSSSCTFDITLQDVTPPVITFCQGDISESVDAGCTYALEDFTAFITATDNCSSAGNIVYSQSPAAGTILNGVGSVHTITLTAKDQSNNPTNCTFDITLQDTTAPVITLCPTNDSRSLGPTCTYALEDFTAGISATDNCSTTGDIVYTQSPVAGTILSGVDVVHTITMTARDESNNSTSCTFDITLEDTTPPVITSCQVDVSKSLDASCGYELEDFLPSILATDNCSLTGDIVYTQSPVAGTMLNGIGAVHTITLTAEDQSNNSTSCTFDITLQDTTSPVITFCPANISKNADNGSCSTIATWSPPTATDNCGPITWTSTHTSGTSFPVGVTPVTFTARDAVNNSATCNFTVTIVDNQNPEFTTCPTGVIKAIENGTCEAVVTWTPPVATDNCGVAITSTHTPGSTFQLGSTKVTYTATDPSGNTRTCQFNVVVKDQTSPVLTGCPSNISVFADENCQAVVTWTPPGHTDNCPGPVTFNSNFDPGDIFPLGVTTVTYTVDDASGNTSLPCSFTVTVVDEIDPVIPVIPDITVSSITSACTAIVSWSPPTATDNCSISTLTSDIASGSSFNVGTTPVTYTATDAGGNSVTRAFNVIVVDDTDPLIPEIPDITVTSSTSSCDALVNWTAPAATDNCAIATLTSDIASGSTFIVGTTPVTYTATDASGNSSTRSFNVTVTDDTSPVITACPENITVQGNASCEVAVSWTPPVATDNCTVMLTSSHNPGATFSEGVPTTVTYTAIDGAGNTSTCSFAVSVTDVVAPVINGCPSADVIASAGESCQAQVSWTAPTTTDCGTVTLTTSHAPGSTFDIGTTEVTYTATDNSLNSSTCKFNVVVQDKTAPVFSGCHTQVTATAGASCDANVTWTEPTVPDNCGVGSVTRSHNPGDTFEIGSTEVTYTATDIYGNTSTCKFEVVVANEHLPLISGCPGDIIVKADETGEMMVDWTAPTAFAQCGEVTLTSSHNPGDTFSLGTTEVEYTATDEAGVTSSCVFNVNVSYEELEFEIAKVITPDGDGINDQWRLPNIEKFKDNTVVVVDRWGSVIYSADGYNNENVIWKGENRSGAVVPTGTYFYTIYVRFVDKVVEKRGFVELIR